MDLSTLMNLCHLAWLGVLAGQCSVPSLFTEQTVFFFQTPERAQNIVDKAFFRALMSQERDVENQMPLGEGQEKYEL